VKYIAKSAAKNINSEESQTMVPTATRLGRLFLTGVSRVLTKALFLISSNY
jgi:hypothetical protein